MGHPSNRGLLVPLDQLERLDQHRLEIFRLQIKISLK